MFLDESGDHSLNKIDSQFPVFCLAGCIFDENEYYRDSDARIDAFKVKYFNDPSIILHSREIRKCEPPFNILLNPHTKHNFYKDLNFLMATLPFTVLASAIRKEDHKNQYVDPANPYILSLMFIVERFLYLLEETDEVGHISVESRDPKANTDLLSAFTDILNNGSYIPDKEYIISGDRFRRRIDEMAFVTKQQNENGHQIADLVAYPIAKFVLDEQRLNPAFEIIRPKFRSKAGEIMGYGLKVFPK